VKFVSIPNPIHVFVRLTSKDCTLELKPHSTITQYNHHRPMVVRFIFILVYVEEFCYAFFLFICFFNNTVSVYLISYFI